MNKLKFQIISLVGKLRMNISVLLIACLLILVVFEVLVIKRAITTVLGVAQANPGVKASDLVRINFSAYDKVVNRIQNAPDYTPSISIQNDPFGLEDQSTVKK